jgi:filamentous hemagglutinin family protein
VRHAKHLWILTRRCGLSLGLSLGAHLAWAAGPAGIKTDGTLGGPATVLAGPTYNITQSLGKLAGGNLFFSFQYFNVATNETALFTTTSPGINNVVSRVTGGFASSIDGTITLNAANGAPNFFFINPSGVTFTANARINVPGAFAVTTADYLKFADGNFYANPATQSTLSAAAPQAFGFLGASRAPVTVTGASLSGGAQGAGEFQITAGDVTIDGAGGQAGIVNSTGNIRITAVGSTAAEVPLAGSFTATDGTVTIENGGIVFTDSGTPSAAGAIQITAGSLLIDGTGAAFGSGLVSYGGAGNSGPITVAVGNDATLVNGGQIASGTFGAGSAAPIQLQSGSLTINAGASSNFTGIENTAYANSSGAAGGLRLSVTGAASLINGGQIVSSTAGTGNAGNIALSAQSLSIEGQNSALPTGLNAGTYGAGNAGQIQLQLAALAIDGGTATNITGISAQSYPQSSGAAGNVVVNVAGAASIVSGGEISSSTNGPGNAGNISLSAQNLTVDSEAATIGTGVLANSYGTGNSGSIQLQLAALSIDGSPTSSFTGISSQATFVGSGSAGDIAVSVAGAASIANGGQISSSTSGAGNGGTVAVSAQSVTINGAAATGVTGITSAALGAGNAGTVSLSAQSLSITGQSANLETGIAVSSYGAGEPGQVNVNVGSLSIDGGNNAAGFIGIFSQSNNGSTESTGDVTVAVTGGASIIDGGEVSTSTFGSRTAGNLSFSAQGLTISNANTAVGTGIFADTYATGDAGQIKLQLGSLSIDGGSGNGNTGIFSLAEQSTGAAGGITLTVAGNTALVNGGIISSSTFSAGNAGVVTLQSGSLSIDGGAAALLTGIISQANSGASGSAGEVTVNVSGAATIQNGAEISSSTFGGGNGGQVSLQAAQLTIDGGTSGEFTGITSGAEQGSGSAGSVLIKVAGAASIVNGGEISSSTFSAGNAGQVNLQFGSLTIDGGTSPLSTGISSDADPGSTGTAGKVTVSVPGAVSIVNGGDISSDTFGPGSGGAVQLEFGTLNLNGSSIGSKAEPGASGAAGAVDLNVAQGVSLSNGAEISSSTFGSGNAGQLSLQLGDLTISGANATHSTGIASQSNPGATGSAGDVTIVVAGAAILEDGGVVSTSTFGPGNAGRIALQADTLLVNGAGASTFTGIASSAQPGSSGAAGAVSVIASGSATLEDGGAVSTKTSGAGAAGDITFTAAALSIGGGAAPSIITSAASAGSGGQTGRITLDTGPIFIGAAGSISISNAATAITPSTLTPTQIALDAQSIDMNGGTITAASTGNIAASAIDITFASLMRMEPGSISTSSNDGNGGPITLIGHGPLFISHSNITTSVMGTHNGNGGNIDIDVTDIVFDTGAIQANTLAPLASGGTVHLQAQALVPSYESFIVGGRAVTFAAGDAGLNLVQAAAPDGVSGTLDITAPIQYLGNSLLGLTGRPLVPTALGRSPCGFTQGSSLAVAGRGGMPVSAYDPLGTIAPADAVFAALDRPAEFACH